MKLEYSDSAAYFFLVENTDLLVAPFVCSTTDSNITHQSFMFAEQRSNALSVLMRKAETVDRGQLIAVFKIWSRGMRDKALNESLSKLLGCSSDDNSIELALTCVPEKNGLLKIFTQQEKDVLILMVTDVLDAKKVPALKLLK